jgi:hypothetical protein
MTLSLLPSDILHKILRHLAILWAIDSAIPYSKLHKQPSYISNLGLACHLFAGATRSHLYKTIHIDSKARCEGLLGLFNINPFLPSCIQHVVVARSGLDMVHDAVYAETLWLFSLSSRTLMPYLSSISTLKLENIKLAQLHIFQVVSQGLTHPLSAVTRLEIISCSYTLHQISVLLEHAPRLEHFAMQRETMKEETDIRPPMMMLTPSHFPFSSLILHEMHIHDAERLEMLVDCLRSSGRVRALRKLTIWTCRSQATSCSWLLVRDACLTLEELVLEVRGGDVGSLRDAILFELTPIELPRLTSLLLRVGSPVNGFRDVGMMESCVNFLSLLRPLSLFSLEMRIWLRTGRDDTVRMTAFWHQLGTLDVCLTSLSLNGLSSVSLLVWSIRPNRIAGGPLPFTEGDILDAMPQTVREGLLTCKARKHHVWNGWEREADVAQK